jgi:hypothetical protein
LAGGGLELVAAHPFSTLSQVPVLVGDIAGSGPLARRPFRLSVTEVPGWLTDRFTASATVDLRCALACFDDPSLGRRVGHALGIPVAQAARLIGRPLGHHLHFRFQISLPGRRATPTGATSAAGWPVAWATPIGLSTSVTARSRSVDRARLDDLRTALVIGSALVSLTAAALAGRGWRRRRRRRRRPIRVAVTGPR